MQNSGMWSAHLSSINIELGWLNRWWVWILSVVLLYYMLQL